MTRKEKEKILLDGLNLRVGDRIEFLNNTNETFTIKEIEEYYYLKNSSNKINDSPLETLIFCDYEKIEPKKKLGDIICKKVNCVNCPLRHFNCVGLNENLFTVLENCKKTDPELYNFLYKRLDKEIENE